MNIPLDLFYEIINFIHFVEFSTIYPVLPNSCIIHYLKHTKITLASSQQIDKLLAIFDQIKNEPSTLNLEIMYTLSVLDTLKLKQLKGKYIKLHCTNKSGTLLDINDAINNFEIREINFYKEYMNLPVVFNLLINYNTYMKTTIVFHNCNRLMLDPMTFFDRRYANNNHYDNIYFTYIKESELNQYFKNHSFMHVLADNYEITMDYIKIKFREK